MNTTQPLPGLVQVSAWPKLTATVNTDGTGVLLVNGTDRACAAESVDALRTGIIARCVAIATSLRRPVRLDVTEGPQTLALAVRPEGFVQLIEPDGTIAAPLGLTVDEGRCRGCRRLQPVTSTTCAQCGVDEPLNVELARLANPNALSSTAASTPVEAPPAAAAPTSAAATRDVELTRIRTPPSPQTPPLPRLHLVFTSREPVTTDGGVTVGRQPTSVDARRAVPVPSPGQMLSRTHANIDVDRDGHITVTDLHSGNGVELQEQPPRQLDPDEPTVVPEGTTLLLGDVYCTVSTILPDTP